ncbi:MAG: hypothetical protein RLZZ282_214 [Verrucomicrobiota bacterium]
MDQLEDYAVQETHLTHEKRRLGFWSKLGGGALTFAILVHAIVLVIGAVWVFQITREPEKKIDFLPDGGGGPGERGATSKVKTKKRAQITPTTNVKRVFAEGATSSYSIPDPGENFGEMATLTSLSSGSMNSGLGNTGSGSGFGKGNSGMGTAGGMGKLFGLIPETMGKRCSKDDRLQRLTQNGGTPACEEAVVKGLRWLKANQKPDGSWGDTNQVGMTGLALLAYFGHCETPASEEFGDSCLKAIVYLVNVGMQNNGKLGSDQAAQPFCYEHGIGTYALAEATTFCKDLKPIIPNLREVTQKAGQFIIDNQSSNGAWSYGYTKTGGDSSVVGWQIQALKACSHTAIKFPGLKPVVDKGLDFLTSCQNDNGGFGYNNKSPVTANSYFTLTGVGMLCFQMWDKGQSSPVRKGAKYITENTKFDYTSDANLYAHYYESQAMMQRGGPDWKKYNDLFRDQMLTNQQPDGAWNNPAGSPHVPNKVMSTCLGTLMMEVYYRFLSTGGNNVKERPHI